MRRPRSQTNVPPRFSFRTTRDAPSASIACATSSPRMTCSVKFFEPTTTVVSAGARVGGAAPGRTASRSDASRRPRSAMRLVARRRRARRRSTQASAPSATSASAAAGIAPARIVGRVDHRQPAEDVFAQPAGADRGRDRGRADADDGRDADAGDDGRQGERQLDEKQQLPRRHPHRDAGFDDRASTFWRPVTVLRTIGSSA